MASILQNRCVECHRSGEIAPFPLMTYEDARPWAEMIAEVVSERRMPPWFANPEFGHFSNSSQLSEQGQHAALVGRTRLLAEGDPAKARHGHVQFRLADRQARHGAENGRQALQRRPHRGHSLSALHRSTPASPKTCG